MPRKKKSVDVGIEAGMAASSDAVVAIKHSSAKRKNLPPAGLEAQGRIEEARRIRYEYNPHLPPVLRSGKDATGADRLPELLAIARQRALSADEAALLAEALRRHEPWLEWSGKREKPWFEVEPVALHMHERVSAQAILRVLARQDVERDLFADPQHDYAQAVQFYQHDVDWANRMILGDSLQVMASLARREDLAGKVQMIYLDPPYGISFRSNFQPDLGNVQPEDKAKDLTREPEMVKAYRDTWTLGIHSYLTYLRDRLQMAKELLADSGSIFVQISDENLHRVRCVLDEIFGPTNFITILTFTKKGSQTGEFVPPINEYILWYSREREKALDRFRPIFAEREECEPDAFPYCELASGEVVSAKNFDPKKGPEKVRFFSSNALFSQKRGPNDLVTLRARPFPSGGNSWKVSPLRISAVDRAERTLFSDNRVRFKRYADDFAAVELSNVWTDLAGTPDKVYVVQTNPRVVERCMLMTTDPGDLVLDPTCGSGTTAYVAEQWGRRWITCDSSRVALALAKHRLLTAKFDFHRMRALSPEDVARNPNGTWLTDPSGDVPGKATFACKTVPHITLKSIARNTSLDPIFAKHEPILAAKLTVLNGALAQVGAPLKASLVGKLIAKHQEQGANGVSDADTRRWLLPGTQAALIKPANARKPLKNLTAKQAEAYRAAIPKSNAWQEWEVPFDTDPDWPAALSDALKAYRAAWRAKMDEVNACISANAEMEELVDKPERVPGVVRVTGPFTMEGVIAVEDGPESPITGAPDELDSFDGDAAVQNAEAHLDKIIRLLKASGVDFPENKNMKFSRLDALTDATMIHAEGEWMNGDNTLRRVAVSIGPAIGNLSAMQVEETLHAAGRRSYDDIVFAGFGFDASAQAIIDADPNPRVRCHMALIRPDVAMGDLLKTQPGSQLFTVFSAPRVKGPISVADGEFAVEVEGMDVYDPVSNTLYPTDKTRIAAWFLDSDYDGRTFCICQAFFPDKTKWAKLAKALGDSGVVEEDAFEALSGLTSLPFPRPERLRENETWRVAVKVIDPRGNEGLRVLVIR